MTPPTTSPVHIADELQAELLLDTELRRVAHLMTGVPRSIQEVSDLGHLNSNRAQYLVTKLIRAGIAELVSVQPWAGWAVKRYRVAQPWFIPFRVTRAESLAQLGLDQWIPAVQQMLNNAVHHFREQDDGQSGYWCRAVSCGWATLQERTKSPSLPSRSCSTSRT